MELLNEILKVLEPTVILIVGVIGSYIGKQVVTFVKSKTTTEDLKKLTEFARISVEYVEQITGVDLVYSSQEKFNIAKERLIFLGKGLGIEASEELLETLIESFVNEFNQDIIRVRELQNDDSESHVNKIMGDI